MNIIIFEIEGVFVVVVCVVFVIEVVDEVLGVVFVEFVVGFDDDVDGICEEEC